MYRISNYIHCFFLLVLSLITLVLDAFAEMPPRAYENMQRRAPEYVTIKVKATNMDETKTSGEWKEERMSVQAEVLQVERSKSGLKAGDLIHIKYTNTKQRDPLSGATAVWARPVPRLREGTTCPAYLWKSEDKADYEPAAGGFSFQDFVGKYSQKSPCAD